MGKVVFGRDDEAGGILVDAVDDSGTLFAAHTGQAVAAAV